MQSLHMVIVSHSKIASRRCSADEYNQVYGNVSHVWFTVVNKLSDH